MFDYLIPNDEVENGTDYHNKIRKQIERLIQTADDRQYSPEEIRTAIETMHSKKHQEKTVSPTKYYSVLIDNFRNSFTQYTTSV